MYRQILVIVTATVAVVWISLLVGTWFAMRNPHGLLLVHPGVRVAGDAVAVDCDASKGFVHGCP